MMKYILSVCACILLFVNAPAQVQNVIIDPGAPFAQPSEPCIGIDPRNPNNVVAGSNTTNVYRSTNGGLTWTRSHLSSTYGVFGDPVILADTTGSFYYFHLSNNSAITTWPDWCDRIVCQRLDNVASGSWTNGGYTGLDTYPSMQDKPWAAVDPQTNTMYVTWTKFDHYGTTNPTDSSNIMFSRSTDKGDTWSAPVRLNAEAGDCVDDDFTVEGAVPCVGKHGEVFVAWDVENAIMFDRSYDGGATWETSDIHVTDMPGGWAYDIPGLNRCDGLSYISCDLSSGPYAGTLYISWSDQRNGPDNTDVWLCKSTDSGSTWTAPMRVNDDISDRHQFMSSMTVDPSTGYIYVLFYDRRNYTDSLSTDVYVALSKNGGASFQNFKISDTAFRPRADIFFGDYTYISAFNNVVRPIWGHLDVNGTTGLYKQQIKTAIIPDSLINPLAVPGVQPLTTDLQLKVFPNPASEHCSVAYTLPSAGDVRLSVWDMLGREVAVLHSGNERSGRHTVAFDARDHGLATGTYLVTVKTPDVRQTARLVLTR